MSFQELARELKEVFRRGVGEAQDDEAFNDLAVRVFRFQYRANAPYRAFVDRRGLDPGAVDRWEAIPPVPTRAFKTVPLVAGAQEDVERVFRTSGTSRGPEERGEHHIRDLSLYRASLLPPFRAHLHPEGRPLPVLALLPSPREVPDSSLSFMVGEVAELWAREHGDAGGEDRDTFFVDPGEGIREGAFWEALLEARDRDEPVLLAGTAFAFVHWLELVEEKGRRVALPAGSRIMETGGFNGRSRTMSRERLYRGLEAAFGIPPEGVVNEYGMTELLSQFYEPVLVEGNPTPGSSRYHLGPPWVRTRVLDPRSLDPLPQGEVGILAHLDLANLGSVSGVLTEDLGEAVPGGFRLRGRSRGAEPRGCSLAMETFLAGAGRWDHGH